MKGRLPILPPLTSECEGNRNDCAKRYLDLHSSPWILTHFSSSYPGVSINLLGIRAMAHICRVPRSPDGACGPSWFPQGHIWWRRSGRRSRRSCCQYRRPGEERQPSVRQSVSPSAWWCVSHSRARTLPQQGGRWWGPGTHTWECCSRPPHTLFPSCSGGSGRRLCHRLLTYM